MLELKNITLHHTGFSLNNISFSVEKGEYFMVLGMSGAGKSMLLETIAGLSQPDNGNIVLNGIQIEKHKPQDREIGLVFQDQAIFPHLTVYENIGYALKGRKLNSVQRQELISKIAARLHIEHIIDRRPSALSGGELQRVALARTLVQEPKVLLLDEPLAAIDSKLRSEIRMLLRQLNREGQTIVHVTHDFDEAVSLAHRVVVIHEGRIIQTGTPGEVFNSPRSEFVAHFVGIKNFFKVRLSQKSTGCIATPAEGIEIVSDIHQHSAEGYMMIRGEDISFSNAIVPKGVANKFEGTITDIASSRTGVEVIVDIGIVLHVSVKAITTIDQCPEVGKMVTVYFDASSVTIISD
jgi:ABC-type Fe3+/spermidine/putrescine transport system ATPase subunit